MGNALLTIVPGRFKRRLLLAASLSLGLAFPTDALTIHRSFRTREAGFSFGTGTATASYPVDARIDQALDAAREHEAQKAKVIVGKVTRILDGATIHVVTDGNVLYKVRLNGLDPTPKNSPSDPQAVTFLAKRIKGRTVRVEWRTRDPSGNVLGSVFLDKTNVNDCLETLWRNGRTDEI